MKIIAIVILVIAVAGLLCITYNGKIRDKFVFSPRGYKQVAWLFLIIIFVLGIVSALSCLFDIRFNHGEGNGWLFHFVDQSHLTDEQNDSVVLTWAFLISIVGSVLFSGLLISTVVNIYQTRINKIRRGEVTYKFKNHVVIIGFEKMAIGLIKQLCAVPEKSDIILLTNQKVSLVRHTLFSRLEKKFTERVVFVAGSRDSREDLEKLRIPECKEIFILGENDEYDHDSLNNECLTLISSILRRAGTKKKKKRCNVLFKYQSTYVIFQQQGLKDMEFIDFVPFNFHESWARKVFVEGKYTTPDNQQTIEYLPLDRERVTPKSKKTVHLVIIGMSRMGIAMGIEASHLAHFPNFIEKKKKTRITFIDKNADQELTLLKGRYKHLLQEIDYSYHNIDTGEKYDNRDKEKFTDLEWEFIKAGVENPKIQTQIEEWSSQSDKLLTIVIAFNFPPHAIATGLYLPDKVYDNNIPILINQNISCSLLHLLESSRKYKSVRPFGMLDNCYNMDLADDLLPMMVKYAYDKTDYKKPAVIVDFPEDEVKENWEKWDDDANISALKWSNRYNADTAYIKQRSFGFESGGKLSRNQIELLARVEHNRWVIEKLLMGYRATTKEEDRKIKKDKNKKTDLKNRWVHPDIRAYDDLLEDHKSINAREYDICISRSLPMMIKSYEKNKKLNNNSNEQL